MQASEGEYLRKLWEAKGNPPCSHPEVTKEYIWGADTGDDVCTTCGATAMRGTLQGQSGTTAE